MIIGDMEAKPWWDQAILYEIFPKAFSKEGFKGIEDKLDYIDSLGIDAIWLCPIFMSPFADSGYDISDYYKVNPMFGSLDDFKSLLDQAHRKGIKIILDIALNHTSNEHPWFQAAIQDKKSNYHDYYVFKKGLGHKPPNQWISSKTRKSTWTYNEKTEDYYLHIYTKYQPDLNWSKLEVRQECHHILTYWLELGVDGFRLDVINKIAKPKDLSLESKNDYSDDLYENHPQSHVYIRELSQGIKASYPNCFLLGQVSGVTPEVAKLYAAKDRQELDSFLQFEHMDINQVQGTSLRQWHLDEFKAIIKKWQEIEGVISTNFLSNHDSARIVNHFTSASRKDALAAGKMLSIFQLCLKGIPIIYMGDELGLTNVSYDHISQFKDIRSHDLYENLLAKGLEPEAVIALLNEISRDHARQEVDFRESSYNEVSKIYKWMINFRKASSVLQYGDFKLLESDQDIFSYERSYKDQALIIVCNFSDKTKLLKKSPGPLLKSTANQLKKKLLMPYEGRLYERKT